MWALRRADPVAGQDFAGPEEREKARAVFERIVETPRDTRSDRRPRPMLPHPVLAAAVVGAVALAALLIAPTLFRETAAPASAAELLNAAADVVPAKASWVAPGTSESAVYRQDVRRTTPYQDRGFRYSIDATIRTSVTSGGQATVETTVAPPRFTDDTMRTAWEQAGRPALAGATPGTRVVTEPLIYHMSDRTLSWSQVNALPTEPSALARALSPAGYQALIYRDALALLAAPAVPPDLQAALYRVLAAQPDLTATEDGDTVRISRADNLTFTFLRATGQLTGVEESSGPGGSMAVLAAGTVGCVQPLEASPPDEIFIGCATGAYRLTDLRWTGWGDDQATATGIAAIVDCDPYCAVGPTNRTPVTVKAGEPRTCGYNLSVYTRLDMVYDRPTKGLINGGTGPDRIGTSDWQEFSCAK